MLKLISIVTILICLFSCSETPDTDELSHNDDTSVSLDILHADHFKLTRLQDDIQLEIINPESNKVEKSIQITPSSDLKIISLTSTLNGMLSVLKKTDQIVGVSDMEYVYDESIKDRFFHSHITEYGDETTQSAEKIIASGADIVFYSGFGDKFPNESLLEKLGIKIIPIYDWREEDPLGKAEWIKLIGAITNSSEEADKFYSKAVEEYDRLKRLASSFDHSPTVLSGNMLGDTWFTPVGDSYVAQLIKDAGGSYTYKESKGTGSLALSIEKVLNDNRKTDIWINPGIDSKEKVLKINPHADLFDSFNNMYCYSPHMNLFWERSAIAPHLVLSDLIHIFHPESDSINMFYFYSEIE